MYIIFMLVVKIKGKSNHSCLVPLIYMFCYGLQVCGT